MLRFALLCAIVSACSSSSPKDADPFATFQACYDEHHVMESFDVQTAIDVCCIDHPIGSEKANVVCGATAQDCTTYVTQNLMDPNDAMLSSDISAACATYVTSRGG